MQTNKFHVLRNTIYIFQQGKLLKYDKTFPFGETVEHYRSIFSGSIFVSSMSGMVFQPSKAKNRKNYFSLTHPYTLKPISCGVEICFEHCLGWLQQSVRKPVQLHFEISDSTYLKEDKIHGSYFMYVDSQFASALTYCSALKDDSIEVIAYQNNCLEADNLELEKTRFKRL